MVEKIVLFLVHLTSDTPDLAQEVQTEVDEVAVVLVDDDDSAVVDIGAIVVIDINVVIIALVDIHCTAAGRNRSCCPSNETQDEHCGQCRS